MNIEGRVPWLASEGDVVVIESEGKRFVRYLKRGDALGTPVGSYPHSEMMGVPFCAPTIALNNVGAATVLRTTPELWLTNLPHRTQIIYHPNVAVILDRLDLRPGSVVVESGTGSGGLTTALARAVAPTGHVYTFDFHKDRAAAAASEFASHGMDHLITVTHGDACGPHGFGKELAEPRPLADAVFLDVPNPWDAIGNAVRVLKHCGRLCSFSPCIEQVKQAVVAMERQGLTEIVTIEVLMCEFDVTRGALPEAGAGMFRAGKRARDAEDRDAAGPAGQDGAGSGSGDAGRSDAAASDDGDADDDTSADPGTPTSVAASRGGRGGRGRGGRVVRGRGGVAVLGGRKQLMGHSVSRGGARKRRGGRGRGGHGPASESAASATVFDRRPVKEDGPLLRFAVETLEKSGVKPPPGSYWAFRLATERAAAEKGLDQGAAPAAAAGLSSTSTSGAAAAAAAAAAAGDGAGAASAGAPRDGGADSASAARPPKAARLAAEAHPSIAFAASQEAILQQSVPVQRALRGFLGPRPMPPSAVDAPPALMAAHPKQGGHNGYLTFALRSCPPGGLPALKPEAPAPASDAKPAPAGSAGSA